MCFTTCHQNETPKFTPSPLFGGRKRVKHAKIWFSTFKLKLFRLTTPSSKVVRWNDQKSILKQFRNRCIFTNFATICYGRIAQTADSICMCDKRLESPLDGLIWSKFISHRGAISTHRARTTAIAVPLVIIIFLCAFYTLSWLHDARL